MRLRFAIAAALVVLAVVALNMFVLDGADEAAWARDADAACADGSAENEALFEAYGPPNSPEIILTVFGRALDGERRAFARIDALEPPVTRTEEVAHLLALWRRELEASASAFAELSKGWSDARLQDWVQTTYPMSNELEQTARRLGSERCGDYFSPDPV